MIRASRGRLLVKVLPAIDDIHNPLNLTLIDKKKHFEHASRKGEITSVGAGVYGVRVGDIVVFRGDAGFTMDGDPEVQRPEFGESYRWLKESDCMAILEPVKELAAAGAV